MKTGKLVTTLGVLVLALSFTPAAFAVLTVTDGSVFHETFNGGAFSEGTHGGYGTNGSKFDGTNATFNANAGRVINSGGIQAEIQAYFTPEILAANADYTIEAVLQISSAGSITENAMIMVLTGFIDAEFPGVKLEAKEAAGGTWDVEVADFNGTTLAGLTLSKDEYHSVAQRHFGDGVIALYVDGVFIANYADLDPAAQFGHINYGNVSGTAFVGFGEAWFNDMAVGNFVPEPATMTLLALGGLSLLRRRNRK